ncbi:NirD/YgiW/YdeI family stress tolerance protein [Vreelandella aquamarina]
MKALTIALIALLSAPAVMASQITSIGDAQKGNMVTLSGTVERISDTDEFRLQDATGSINIYVGPNWVPAQVGDAIQVTGFVDDGFGPREVYARQLTLADGSVVQFEHRYE